MPDARRTVFGLSVASVSVLTLVASYQTNLLKNLPGPSRGPFNADKLHDSPEAYPLGIPDAFLGIASYGTTAVLSQNATLPSLATKTAIDTAVAAAMTLYGWRKQRTLSIYSLFVGGASVISFATSFFQWRGSESRRAQLNSTNTGV